MRITIDTEEKILIIESKTSLNDLMIFLDQHPEYKEYSIESKKTIQLVQKEVEKVIQPTIFPENPLIPKPNPLYPSPYDEHKTVPPWYSPDYPFKVTCKNVIPLTFDNNGVIPLTVGGENIAPLTVGENVAPLTVDNLNYRETTVQEFILNEKPSFMVKSQYIN